MCVSLSLFRSFECPPIASLLCSPFYVSEGVKQSGYLCKYLAITKYHADLGALYRYGELIKTLVLKSVHVAVANETRNGLEELFRSMGARWFTPVALCPLPYLCILMVTVETRVMLLKYIQGLIK